MGVASARGGEIAVAADVYAAIASFFSLPPRTRSIPGSRARRVATIYAYLRRFHFSRTDMIDDVRFSL